MGIGMKRLFAKKKTKNAATTTPTKSNGAPGTPPTQPIDKKSPSQLLEDLPVKKLLDDLNVCETKDDGEKIAGEFEVVIGKLKLSNDDPPSTSSEDSMANALEVKVPTTPEIPSATIAPDSEVESNDTTTLLTTQYGAIEISQENQSETMEISQESQSETMEISHESESDVAEVSQESESDAREISHESSQVLQARESEIAEVSQESESEIAEISQESMTDNVEISQDTDRDVHSDPDSWQPSDEIIEPDSLEMSQDGSGSEPLVIWQDTSDSLDLSQSREGVVESSPLGLEKPADIEQEKEGDEDQIASINSDLLPRRLDLADTVTVSVGQRSVIDAEEDNEKARSTKHHFSSTFVGVIARARQYAEDMVIPDAAQCSGAMVIPEPVRKLIPTIGNACIPIIGPRSRDLDKIRPSLVRQYSYYDETFAQKMLDELINVGFALVHHQMLKANDGGEEGDWVGRSVTLILRPGICNRLQVQAPYLEWVTMGGGLNNVVESTALSLLDIHSVSTSNLEDMTLRGDGEDQKDEDGSTGELEENEDLQCLFSLTTKQGQIHVMEAITADESQRLVAGVKNLASGLSRQLIAGDVNVLADFFENAQEPDEIRLSEEEAMLRVSHALLDYMSRA